MERVISPEERIKRAEEIYYRRKAQGVRVSTASVNIVNTNKISLGKKMVIQIIVCILIYSAFWALSSYKSVFSESVINQTKEVLSYDINFQKLYNQSREYFESNFNNIIKTNSNQNGDMAGDENADNGGDESTENIDGNSEEDNSSEDNADNNGDSENQPSENSSSDGGSDVSGEENVENNLEKDGVNEPSSNNPSGNENTGIRRRIRFIS